MPAGNHTTRLVELRRLAVQLVRREHTLAHHPPRAPPHLPHATALTRHEAALVLDAVLLVGEQALPVELPVLEGALVLQVALSFIQRPFPVVLAAFELAREHQLARRRERPASSVQHAVLERALELHLRQHRLLLQRLALLQHLLARPVLPPRARQLAVGEGSLLEDAPVLEQQRAAALQALRVVAALPEEVRRFIEEDALL